MMSGPLLTDTGPLVALINRNDPHHQRRKAAVREWPATPLLTTWPCWTEAMYLLFRAGGFGDGIHQYQSSQSKPGARLNSRVLWVTRIAWCAKAVPAIR